MAIMQPVTINGEWDIILPEHRANRPEWYRPEGWEKKRLQKLHEVIEDLTLNTKSTPIVYYVGAEEGDMAALCAMWFSRLILFEPNEKVWPNIKAIFDANKLETPLLSFVGFASNKDDYRYLEKTLWPECAVGPLIGDHGFKELHDSGNIRQIKIDTLVEKTNYIPDIISIDVEGSEWEVLKGAEKTLYEHHPHIFLSGHPEFMFRIYGQYLYDLRAWIKHIGYHEEIIDYQHEVHLHYYL